MKKVYTTANGKRINIDAIISQNEETIAIGNMGVNARGDQLGPGGIVETSKNKIMSDYYKLNTPVAVDNPPRAHKVEAKKDLTDDWLEPVEPAPVNDEAEPDSPRLRGSLADAVAKTQIKTNPAATKKTGPSRI